MRGKRRRESLFKITITEIHKRLKTKAGFEYFLVFKEKSLFILYTKLYKRKYFSYGKNDIELVQLKMKMEFELFIAYGMRFREIILNKVVLYM